MSVMCCVCHVFPSCVHIWFVYCPRLVSLLVHYVPAVFDLVSDYPVYLIPVCLVSVVWSTCYSRCVYPALSCPGLFELKTVYLSLLLVIVFLISPGCVHHDNHFKS